MGTRPLLPDFIQQRRLPGAESGVDVYARYIRNPDHQGASMADCWLYLKIVLWVRSFGTSAWQIVALWPWDSGLHASKTAQVVAGEFSKLIDVLHTEHNLAWSKFAAPFVAIPSRRAQENDVFDKIDKSYQFHQCDKIERVDALWTIEKIHLISHNDYIHSCHIPMAPSNSPHLYYQMAISSNETTLQFLLVCQLLVSLCSKWIRSTVSRPYRGLTGSVRVKNNVRLAWTIACRAWRVDAMARWPGTNFSQDVG